MELVLLFSIYIIRGAFDSIFYFSVDWQEDDDNGMYHFIKLLKVIT
jgi:hypothetical protein